MDLIRKYDCEKWVYFMSANDKALRLVHEYAPDLKRCVGWDGNEDKMSMVRRAIALKADKIQLFRPYFDQETVKAAHEHGIICNVFWADEPEVAREYLEMGIDTILTNDYHVISQVVAEYKNK